MARQGFATEVLSQAMGTVIGGLVLLVAAKAAGLFGDADWRSIAFLGSYFGTLFTIAVVLWITNWQRERRRMKAEEKDQRESPTHRNPHVWDQLSAQQQSEVEAVVAAVLRGFDLDPGRILPG
jgi:hypothetical protein